MVKEQNSRDRGRCPECGSVNLTVEVTGHAWRDDGGIENDYAYMLVCTDCGWDDAEVVESHSQFQMVPF
jgi:predicted nucleic-acid-binding Zn-ribbon protein